MAKEKFFDSFEIMSPKGDAISIKLYTKGTGTYNYEYAEAFSAMQEMCKGE